MKTSGQCYQMTNQCEQQASAVEGDRGREPRLEAAAEWRAKPEGHNAKFKAEEECRIPAGRPSGGADLGSRSIVSPIRGGSPWMTEAGHVFRQKVRRFIKTELEPHQTEWAEKGMPDLEVWAKAGAAGLLLPDVPREYGGGGGTFAHEAIIVEELARSALNFAFTNHSIVARYILAYGSDEQKHRWLPRMASGELVAAIAMTEPDCGSDLKAIRTTARKDGDFYVVDGAKAFVTNAGHASLVCLAARSDRRGPALKALSLLVVETKDLVGYKVGRPLRKIGRAAVDVCELFFDGVRVPAHNLLGGREGSGLLQMMEQLTYERLVIGLSAVAAAESAVDGTIRYVKQRKASGEALLDLQNTRFRLAECKTEAHVGRVFIDNCIEQFTAGRLSAVTAAMAKYWLTDSQSRIIDECLQLHGGDGYGRENAIARMWADARAQRIYAGSNEIMKEVVGASL